MSANGRRRVAVTGIGVVTPVAIGAEPFWEGLLEGRSGITPIDVFDASSHPVRIAGQVRDFEPRDWVDVKDAKRLDRFCHLAVAAAVMAVEDARFAPRRPDRVGTIFGSGVGGVKVAGDNIIAEHERGPRRVVPFFIPGSIPNMATCQVSMRLGFSGPSTCTVTACASSADAVGWGFRLVRDGYADACMVGGTEAPVHPAVIAGFANMRALSTRNHDPGGASRPFEADRDGFVLSEGAGALLLESLDGARERGASVYAELCGFGQAGDAYHETAPDPAAGGPARAIASALEDAGLEPADVGYVNAHATSTRMADEVETKAMHRVFGERARELPISSTKSMTGHMLGAAGAVESAVCALALRHGWLPPTINYARPDAACDLDYVPNEPRRAAPRAVLSNSMGFGGHNACLAFRALAPS
ncbi:MAG TPA: beta-ketoacyl-ACP synthase II [Thermoleophilaceae bacterium]|jgi:3-oxoacyl-[acyl-carrier-protein] synthase II